MEVIVIDDGSTDDTSGTVERDYPQVKLIRTPNQGASHARNLGTSLATGEFVQYLDADDLLAEGKLHAQIEALKTTGADVAYGDWQRLVPDGNGGYADGERVARQMQRPPELELFGDFWCPPAAYLFRHSIVDQVGQWNEGLPIIQDARFALDCALYGGTFTHCPGVMAYYRQHGEDSLSRRDPLAFNRDIHRNASEVEQWWRSHGGLTKDRTHALVDCYGYVARATYERDRPTFEQVYGDLQRLSPGYVPRLPRHLAMTARLIGYRNAEAAALVYRRAKRILMQEQA
jgi:glycosyltransferase involved in cell wall biosynthesis